MVQILYTSIGKLSNQGAISLLDAHPFDHTTDQQGSRVRGQTSYAGSKDRETQGDEPGDLGA